VNLEPIDVTRLDVCTALPDLRRDIHIFMDYLQGREVKRAHRNNALSKSDAKRLARLMSDPNASQELDEEEGSSSWIDFVDHVALKLGFVHYDTKGVYAGYTSAAASFPDNYIEVKSKPYQQFLAAKAAKQETTLLELLLKEGGPSEFYSIGVLGRLDRFNYRGSGTGVVPKLDFPAARRFLLGLLAECPPGQWLSTAALVEHLKKNHRYFLIPAKPRYQYPGDEREGRYGNFHESKDSWGYEIDIHEGEEDAFERVEGRYVERFLEGIPLVLRYVDVGYAQKRPKAIYPSLGCLQAFRVSERLGRALQGQISEPRVTVTPNFDVHIISETYPASIFSQLEPLCEMVSEGTSIVLKLNKQKVAVARAAHPNLDAAGLLQSLCEGELPANVVHELSDWSEHGEKFILYADCSVLEADRDLPAANSFTVERVAPEVRIVHSPDKLFDELERKELIPVRVKHGGQAFAPVSRNWRSQFPKESAARQKIQVPQTRVTLTRMVRVQLVCPDREFLDKLHRLLLEGKCLVEIDRPNLTLSYSKQYESEVANAIRKLKTDYRIEIEDITS